MNCMKVHMRDSVLRVGRGQRSINGQHKNLTVKRQTHSTKLVRLIIRISKSLITIFAFACFTGDDTKGVNIDSDKEENSSCSSYHRAYLQAEIKPKTEPGSSIGTKGFNVFITALVGGVWKLEEDPEDYTCKHLCEMRTVKEETLRESRYGDQRFFYKR